VKRCLKKKLKKKWFSFLQTFFLKSILDIFLCPISKLKKSFENSNFFHFSTLGKLSFIPRKSIFHIFFVEIAFSGELFVISHFLSWFILFYMIFYELFVFFYFINEKIYYYKIFFHYKCSYKLSTVIQKILNFIQKLSIRSEKNKKISKKSQKIPKKSDFFTFFLMVSPPFLSKIDWSFNVIKIEKNVRKKNWKKSDFHFYKLFF